MLIAYYLGSEQGGWAGVRQRPDFLPLIRRCSSRTTKKVVMVSRISLNLNLAGMLNNDDVICLLSQFTAEAVSVPRQNKCRSFGQVGSAHSVLG